MRLDVGPPAELEAVAGLEHALAVAPYRRHVDDGRRRRHVSEASTHIGGPEHIGGRRRVQVGGRRGRHDGRKRRRGGKKRMERRKRRRTTTRARRPRGIENRVLSGMQLFYLFPCLLLCSPRWDGLECISPLLRAGRRCWTDKPLREKARAGMGESTAHMCRVCPDDESSSRHGHSDAAKAHAGLPPVPLPPFPTKR